MSIKLHLLNAGGKLSPCSSRLEAAFSQSVASIAALLPVNNVDVVVQAGRRVLPETGIVGHSHSAEVIYITLDPDHPTLQAPSKVSSWPLWGTSCTTAPGMLARGMAALSGRR